MMSRLMMKRKVAMLVMMRTMLLMMTMTKMMVSLLMMRRMLCSFDYLVTQLRRKQPSTRVARVRFLLLASSLLKARSFCSLSWFPSTGSCPGVTFAKNFGKKKKFCSKSKYLPKSFFFFSPSFSKVFFFFVRSLIGTRKQFRGSHTTTIDSKDLFRFLNFSYGGTSPITIPLMDVPLAGMDHTGNTHLKRFSLSYWFLQTNPYHQSLVGR